MTTVAELLQDPHRLAALYRLELQDQPPTAAWSHLVRSAAAACRTPMGAIATRLLGAEQTTAITDAETIAADGLLGPAGVQWVAGQALHSRDGHAIGAFVVLDTAARDADAATTALVADFAALAEALVAKRDLEQTAEMLQTSLNGLREALHDQATLDPDTRLWSHKGLTAILPQELARAQREGKVVSIVLAEIDDAPMIRQRHGHAAVQHALKEVATRIRAAVRPYDLIGRFGPAQFLIALIGGDAESAKRTATRIRNSVGTGPVPFYDDELFLEVTLGLATGTDIPMDATETLVGAAASALAQAKTATGDKVVVSKV
jgi:diguanylate cyclase (GGDEF)-like protein